VLAPNDDEVMQVTWDALETIRHYRLDSFIGVEERRPPRTV